MNFDAFVFFVKEKILLNPCSNDRLDDFITKQLTRGKKRLE